jgi:hypothetical protein
MLVYTGLTLGSPISRENVVSTSRCGTQGINRRKLQLTTYKGLAASNKQRVSCTSAQWKISGYPVSKEVASVFTTPLPSVMNLWQMVSLCMVTSA